MSTQHLPESWPLMCLRCLRLGTYWEDRVPVRNMIGYEVRAAGVEHADGRICIVG